MMAVRHRMIYFNKIVLTTLTLLISFTTLAQTERGKASYYSKSWSGRKTANPFGTLLKVTNPANGLSVIVKVTDRGPYVKGRVVDLSVRAAKELGILSQGIAPVIVERYNPSIIPFKPEDLELPEFDLGTNEGSSAKPIWMELRDQRIKRRQEQTKLETEKKAMERRKIEIRDSIAQSLANEDVLDEINSKPNHSKAYLKRNRK